MSRVLAVMVVALCCLTSCGSEDPSVWDQLQSMCSISTDGTAFHVVGNAARRLDCSYQDVTGVDFEGFGELYRSAEPDGAILNCGGVGCFDFTGADLSNVRLQGRSQDMNSSLFIRADLTGLLAGSEPGHASMSFNRADFTEADLTDADLRRASLRKAIFVGANLTGADLEGAILHEANLEGADLTGADLGGTEIYGVNFAGTDLFRTRLHGAIAGEEALNNITWPSGFDPEAAGVIFETGD